MRRWISALIPLFMACSGQPKDAAEWARRAQSRSHVEDQLRDLEQVSAATGGVSAAAPHLVELLKGPPAVRKKAAALLAESVEPSLAPKLVAALDPGLALPNDSIDANRIIAKAVLSLRPRVGMPMLETMALFPDPQIQREAIDAIAEVGGEPAVAALSKVAMSQQTELMNVGRAVRALGRLGSPAAVPVITRFLLVGRDGFRFTQDALEAAFHLGSPMVEPLLQQLRQPDPTLLQELQKSAEDESVVFARAASALAVLQDTRAIPALEDKLGYRNANLEAQQDVRAAVAMALGRLRSAGAAKAIARLAAEEREPMVQRWYCEAVALTGNREALAVLAPAFSAPGWELRQQALVALSRLGDERDEKTLRAAETTDAQLLERSCDQPSREPDEPGCAEERTRHREAFAQMRARLAVKKRCRGELPCWTERLGDEDAAVRDRAALEVAGLMLGSRPPPETVSRVIEALVKAVERPVGSEADGTARWPALLALHWILGQRRDIPVDAPSLAARLEAVADQDSGNGHAMRALDDTVRVAVRLRRLARPEGASSASP
jgi:HEAT repeat protein